MKHFAYLLLLISLSIFGYFSSSHWLPQPSGRLNYLGYVEGETTLIGAPQVGRLISVNKEEGQFVKAGEPLFSLDPLQTEKEVARAEATVGMVKANYDNLLTGQRSEEKAVIRAQIAQTEASLSLAEKQLQRASALAISGTASAARLDEAQQQVNLYRARLAELRASEQVAELGARSAEISAAASRIAEAQAQLDQARKQLQDLTPTAPSDAQVEDLFFKTGEWVSAGQPVISLLTPSDIRLRFFIPQAALAKAEPGTKVSFLCDGCSGYRSAIISRVASRPEYSPPVIYSEGTRAKLVYLVEAKPERLDEQLRPGLPIEVEPLK